MIHLLGASHIMAILDACAGTSPPAAVPNFGRGAPPAFMDWPVQPGMLPDRLQVASIHASHTAPFWGPTLVDMLPGGQLGVADGLRALLAAAHADAACQTLFITLRGEEYFNLGIAGVAHPFDFVLPQRPDLAPLPDRALVPLALVQQQLDAQLARTLLTLTAVRKLCPRLAVVRIPAPPPASSAAVAAWAATRDRPEQIHKVPTSVRLKLWLLSEQRSVQHAASLGLQCLPVPAEALDPVGTLRADLMQDGIHGNARYGALVCAQMAAIVTETMEGVH